MKKWIKNSKLMGGISAMLAMLVLLLAVPPIVHGGGRWSGIDPVLSYEGKTVNIWVEWPEEYTCSLSGLITMQVNAPGATLISESKDTFACADGSSNTIETKTTVINSGKKGYLQVMKVVAKATQTFPVNVLTYVDGSLMQTCSGYSNKSFDCKVFRVY
jgi:hypothetical protein